MSKKDSYDDSSSSIYRGHRHRVRHGPDVPIVLSINSCSSYTETISVPSFDSQSGRYRRVKQPKFFDPIQDLSKYKVSDFYLENQIESGSINNLSRVTMVNNDLSASEAHVLDSLSRFDFEDSNNNNINS